MNFDFTTSVVFLYSLLNMLYITVDLNRQMIVVKGDDSSGKCVSRWDPAVACDEETHGPPGESVRLQRKSTD